MIIAKDTMVSVTYELKYDDADAQLIEKVEKENKELKDQLLRKLAEFENAKLTSLNV